jgi:hypothetical protein
MLLRSDTVAGEGGVGVKSKSVNDSDGDSGGGESESVSSSSMAASKSRVASANALFFMDLVGMVLSAVLRFHGLLLDEGVMPSSRAYCSNLVGIPMAVPDGLSAPPIIAHKANSSHADCRIIACIFVKQKWQSGP